MNYERLDERPNGLVLTASLDKMLFEDRNRSYGAYQIRTSDNRRLMISTYLTAALVLIVTLILFFRFSQPEGPQQNSFVPIVTDFEGFEMPIVDTPEDPEPPETRVEPNDPAPASTEPLPTDQFLTPEPSPIADPTTTVIDQSAITNPGATTSEGGGTVAIGPEGPGGTGTGPATPEPPITLDETSTDYWTAKHPVALNLDDIKKSIVYPPQMKEIGENGDVVLKILVDEKGNYHSHKVLKSSHKLFLKEVESRVTKLTFTPGNQAGKDVRVWVTIPFKFRLSR